MGSQLDELGTRLGLNEDEMRTFTLCVFALCSTWNDARPHPVNKWSKQVLSALADLDFINLAWEADHGKDLIAGTVVIGLLRDEEDDEEGYEDVQAVRSH